VNSSGIETSCAWAVIDPEPVVDDYGPPDFMRVFASVSREEELDKIEKRTGLRFIPPPHHHHHDVDVDGVDDFILSNSKKVEIYHGKEIEASALADIIN
jgi:hypothetical protein